MNLSLGNVFERVENRQQQALVALAHNSMGTGPPLSPKNYDEVQTIARRTTNVLDRLRRLRDKLEKHPGDKAYLDLPEHFVLEDVERKLGILDDDDDGGGSPSAPPGPSRTRPDSENTRDDDDGHSHTSERER